MRLLTGIIIAVLWLSTTVRAEEAPNVIKYDKQKDALSISVNKVSLKQVLATIAIQSHIEALFDDRADEPITMSFEDRPLEEGLKNLLRGSSYAFRYTRDANDKALLIGVSVLPRGDAPDAKVGDANAQPLLEVTGEVFMHAKNNRQLSIEAFAKQEAYNQRWQARLAELPADVRARAEQHAREKLEAHDKKSAKREEHAASKKAEREERKKASEVKRQELLESMSPEDRAFAEQRRKNAEQAAAIGQ